MAAPSINVPSWIETANAANGLATAQRAAEAGGIAHHITNVSGSFSSPTNGALLTLKQGSTELARWYVYNSFAFVFASPVRVEPGNLAELELAAGGAGVTGAVTMTGFTL